MPSRSVLGLVAALIFVGTLFAASLNGRIAADRPMALTRMNPAALVPAHAAVIGAADADVTIIEFFDPACEACRAFYQPVKSILAEYPDDVRLVLRYAPFHNGSEEAVRILHAAHLQGKFEAVLTALMEHQHEWAAHSALSLEKAWTIAERAGLELATARIAGFAEGADEVLAHDKSYARNERIQETPTFLVNGRRLETLSEDGLRDLVVAEIARARAQTGDRE